MLQLDNYPTGPTVVGGANVSVTAPAPSTDEAVLATFKVPALRKNDGLRVTAQYLHTNSANDKAVKVKLGATVLGQKLTSAKAGDKLVVDIANRGATNSQIGEDGAVATVETGTGEAILTITGQKATGAEVLTLAHWRVELIQPPTR